MPNLTFAPSPTYEPSWVNVPYSIPIIFSNALILVSSSSYDDSEDENPSLPTHPPLVESVDGEILEITLVK
jgi:hypothetical protein